MRKSLPLLLAALLGIASCAAPARTPNKLALRFTDGGANTALAKVRDTVARLVARGRDGSVFVLEPDAADLSRTGDALLALGAGDGGLNLLLPRRDAASGLVRLSDDGELTSAIFDTWRVTRLAGRSSPYGKERLRRLLADGKLTATLRPRMSGGPWTDEKIIETSRILDIAGFAGLDGLWPPPVDWCADLATSLHARNWSRSAALTRIVTATRRHCPAPDEATRQALDTDPTAAIAADVEGVEAFPAAVAAADRATVRGYLGLPPAPAKGCLQILRTTARDGILPNLPDALVERCVAAVGEAALGPDVRRALQRTVDTSGALPDSLRGNARAAAFQWDLLRRLGYADDLAAATWKTMIPPQSETGPDVFLRDLLLTPSRITSQQVDALIAAPDDTQRALLVSSYVRRTRSCEPRWTSWMRTQSGDSELDQASLLSALRVCGASDPVTAVDRATADSGSPTERSTINQEWLKVEARCLLGLPIPQSRLRRDLTAALRQNFADAHLGSRLYYAILRTAEILDRGCTKAWWG